MSYDRYSKFRMNGTIKTPYTVSLPIMSTDYYEIYERGKTRLDVLSYNYYGDANYDWLILMANPSIDEMEFSIPNGTSIRIPYPLRQSLENYETAINRLETLYGLE